jgi:glycosyltransferase involved in cell wall biosynthesis
MNVLLICQYYYPDLVSTGLHMTELTIKMKELDPDLNISVFTAESNRSEFINTKQKTELYKGVFIKRVRNLGKHSGTLFQRFIFAFTFFCKAFFYVLFNRKKFDKIIITTNPPFLGIITLFTKKIFRIPFVLIVYDIHPQTLVKLGLLNGNSFITKMWRWINIKIYNSADNIISIGNDMTEIIIKDMKVKNIEKISLIHNWADRNSVFSIPLDQNQFVRKYNLEGKKIFLYSGTIGTTHNVEPILEAAEDLSDFKDILFVFIGSGGKRKIVEQFISEKNPKNLILLEFQPFELLTHALSSATSSFVCLDDNYIGLSVPSKAYAIMAAGIPIIGLLDFKSEIGSAIIKHDCGIVWNSKSQTKLSEEILKLISDKTLIRHLSENAYNAFKNNYDLEISASKYISLINSH